MSAPFFSLVLPLDCVVESDAGKGVRRARYHVRRELSLAPDGDEEGRATSVPGGPHITSNLAYSLFLMFYSRLFSCFVSVIVLTFSPFSLLFYVGTSFDTSGPPSVYPAFC